MKRIRLIVTSLVLVLLVLVALPVLAQSSKPLPETYVSGDERLTLRYPAGWVLQTDMPGQIIAATDESLFSLNDEAVGHGQAAFGALFLDSESDLVELLQLGDEPLAILQTLSKTLFEQDDDDVSMGTPYALTFADFKAARMDGTFAGNALFMMLVDQGSQNYVLYIGITAAGEMPKFEPKLLAIAESLHYLPSGG